MCLLVGLLYGAMLPMLPTRPIILGGIIGPLLWTGLLYHVLGFVNPLLDEKINWVWFAASQVAFGVVAGLGRGASKQGVDHREPAAGGACRTRSARHHALA